MLPPACRPDRGVICKTDQRGREGCICWNFLKYRPTSGPSESEPFGGGPYRRSKTFISGTPGSGRDGVGFRRSEGLGFCRHSGAHLKNGSLSEEPRGETNGG